LTDHEREWWAPAWRGVKLGALGLTADLADPLTLSLASPQSRELYDSPLEERASYPKDEHHNGHVMFGKSRLSESKGAGDLKEVGSPAVKLPSPP